MTWSTNGVSKKYPPNKIIYRDGQKHLILRPFEPTDAPKINEAIESSLTELHQFMAWSHQPISLSQQVDYILKCRSDYFLGFRFEMGVFDGKTNEFLMGAAYHLSNRLNPLCFEIGYWTVTKHTGKGLATLATKILTAVAFEFLAADRVTIACDLANLASRRVIEKCQFHFEGELRNAVAKPRPEMIQKGYLTTRRLLSYSLIPEDRALLEWYPKILEKIEISTLFNEVVKK